MAADEAEARRRLLRDEDFVVAKRFNDSLVEVLKRYPDGVPDRAAAQMLQLSEGELESEYQRVLGKLRDKMGVRDTSG